MARKQAANDNAKMKRKDYEKELRRLQIELCHLQDWVMYGRRPRCKRNLTISEAFGCGHVFGL